MFTVYACAVMKVKFAKKNNLNIYLLWNLTQNIIFNVRQMNREWQSAKYHIKDYERPDLNLFQYNLNKQIARYVCYIYQCQLFLYILSVKNTYFICEKECLL